MNEFGNKTSRDKEREPVRARPFLVKEETWNNKLKKNFHTNCNRLQHHSFEDRERRSQLGSIRGCDWCSAHGRSTHSVSRLAGRKISSMKLVPGDKCFCLLPKGCILVPGN